MLSFLAFACLGLFFAFRPTLFSGFSWMQADPGDSRLSQYVLEHSYLWLRGSALHHSFWNAPFFFPEANVSAYTDLHLGTAPLYWACRWMGFLPDTSTQLWLIALALLNFGMAYVFLRRALSFSSLPSSLGAFFFAFSSPRICQIAHFQLYEHFWTLISLWAVIEIFKPSAEGPERREGRERKWIWVFFVSWVLQLYSAFYLGWFLSFALYLACWTAMFSKDARRALAGFIRRRKFTLLSAASLSAIALWPMASHFLRAAARVGMKHFDEVEYYAPRLPSWFYLGQKSWLYGWLNAIPFYHFLPAKAEHLLGIGLVSTFLAVKTLHKNRKLPLWNYLWIVGILLFALSTRIQPFYSWPWFVAGYKGFPGGGAIRSVGRVGLVLLIPVMIALAAYFEKSKIDGLGKLRWKSWALIALIVLEQGQWLTSFDKKDAREAARSVSRAVPTRCKSFYLVAEENPASADPDLRYQLDAMLGSTLAGIPTVNGYSGNTPPGWSLKSRSFDAAKPEEALRDWLKRYARDSSASCVVRAAIAPIRTRVEAPAFWPPWKEWARS